MIGGNTKHRKSSTARTTLLSRWKRSQGWSQACHVPTTLTLITQEHSSRSFLLSTHKTWKTLWHDSQFRINCTLNNMSFNPPKHSNTHTHHLVINCHYCNVDVVLFHNATYYTNSKSSPIHVNTIDLLNITCTLVFGRIEECINIRGRWNQVGLLYMSFAHQ